MPLQNNIDHISNTAAVKSGFSTMLNDFNDTQLKKMLIKAHKIRMLRFGRTINMYVPLYLSNFCINNCVYCGFNSKNKMKRTALTVEQAIAEADSLFDLGFRNILLVAGEDPQHITTEYLIELTGRLKNKFSSIGIEIAPQSHENYKKLREAGVDSLTVYQETYNLERYKVLHFNKKADYDYRLNTPVRAAEAGIKKINLGILFGLSDWKEDLAALFNHISFLRQKYWRVTWGVGLPRLREAQSQFTTPYIISDREFVYSTALLRIFFPEISIFVSTRENEEIREMLMKAAANFISAGSKTTPGGYSHNVHEHEQFAVSDLRAPDVVAKWIKSFGFEPVWKDWDINL